MSKFDWNHRFQGAPALGPFICRIVDFSGKQAGSTAVYIFWNGHVTDITTFIFSINDLILLFMFFRFDFAIVFRFDCWLVIHVFLILKVLNILNWKFNWRKVTLIISYCMFDVAVTADLQQNSILVYLYWMFLFSFNDSIFVFSSFNNFIQLLFFYSKFEFYIP